jgi:hypothetical protein
VKQEFHSARHRNNFELGMLSLNSISASIIMICAGFSDVRSLPVRILMYETVHPAQFMRIIRRIFGAAIILAVAGAICVWFQDAVSRPDITGAECGPLP